MKSKYLSWAHNPPQAALPVLCRLTFLIIFLLGLILKLLCVHESRVFPVLRETHSTNIIFSAKEKMLIFLPEDFLFFF